MNPGWPDIEIFVKERNAALLSLDEKRIREHSEKWGVRTPKDKKVFWAGVHKALCNIKTTPIEQLWKSMAWLKDNGFSPVINQGEK